MALVPAHPLAGWQVTYSSGTWVFIVLDFGKQVSMGLKLPIRFCHLLTACKWFKEQYEYIYFLCCSNGCYTWVPEEVGTYHVIFQIRIHCIYRLSKLGKISRRKLSPNIPNLIPWPKFWWVCQPNPQKIWLGNETIKFQLKQQSCDSHLRSNLLWLSTFNPFLVHHALECIYKLSFLASIKWLLALHIKKVCKTQTSTCM